VYATTGGQIHYLSGSSFVSSTVTPLNTIGFTDIAMSPDGTKGCGSWSQREDLSIH